MVCIDLKVLAEWYAVSSIMLVIYTSLVCSTAGSSEGPFSSSEKKLRHLSQKFLSRTRGLANPGSSGKWPFKQRQIYTLAVTIKHKYFREKVYYCQTTTTTTVLCPPLDCAGTTRVSWYQKGKTKKVKPIWIYSNKWPEHTVISHHHKCLKSY